MRRSKLDIYEYSNFRSYIRDRFLELKSEDKKYSLRYMAKKLELSSNSHLKMVMDGSHNLSVKLAKRLSSFFGLNRQETDFFLALIEYGQAKTTKDQAEALDELRRVSRFSRIHQLELDQFDYYNDRLLLVLREMVALPEFQEDPKWISRRLPFNANKRDIGLAIEKLLRLKLLKRLDDGGLAASYPHITTGDGLDGVAIKGYYMNGFSLASESLELPGTTRQVGGMTMAISKNAYAKIVGHFREFMDTIRAEVGADQSPDDVYQLVMGFHPLTKVDAGEEGDVS